MSKSGGLLVRAIAAALGGILLWPGLCVAGASLAGAGLFHFALDLRVLLFAGLAMIVGFVLLAIANRR